MSLRCLMIALLCSTFTVAATAEKNLKLNKEASKIGFVGSKPEGTHEGGFKTFDVKATADFEAPENSTLEIMIDTTSLWSDNDKLTNHLKNPDFFDVRKYPKATFKSSKIIHSEEEGKATIVGTMKMLDKEVEVKIPATVTVGEDKVTLVADFKIDRTKWGMSYGKGKIDDEVAIKANLVFTR